MYLHGTPSCTKDDAAPNRCEVSLPREVSRVAASFLEAGWRRFPPGAVILLPLLVLLGCLGPYFCRPVKAPSACNFGGIGGFYMDNSTRKGETLQAKQLSLHYNTRSLIMTLIMREVLIMRFGGFLMRIRTHNWGS